MLSLGAVLAAPFDRTFRVVKLPNRLRDIPIAGCDVNETLLSQWEADFKSDTAAGVSASCVAWPTVKKCVTVVSQSTFGENLGTAVISSIEALCKVDNNGLPCAVSYFAANPKECRTRLPANCGNCTRSYDGSRCLLPVTSAYVTAVCSDCFDSVVQAMRAVLLANATSSSDAEQEYESYKAAREAICSKLPNGDKCIDTLHMVATNDAQTATTQFTDDETSEIPYGIWPEDVSKLTCESSDNRKCFRKVTLGYLNSKALRASAVQKECLNQGNSVFECARRKAVNLWKLNAFQQSSVGICLRNAKADTCMELPESFTSEFVQCTQSAYEGTCSPTCKNLFRQEVASMGCCAAYILPSQSSEIFSTMFPDCMGFWENLVTETACFFNKTTPVRRTIPIRVLFEVVQNNATLRNLLSDLIVRDLSARFGLPSAYIVDMWFENGRGQNASLRDFQSLAVNASEETRFAFGISGSTESDTNTIVNAFDADLSTLELPATSIFLQEEGLIHAGQSANEDEGKPSTSGKDDSGLSTGAIVGIIVAIAVVVIVLLIVVVVVMRKKSNRQAYQEVREDQQSMTTGA